MVTLPIEMRQCLHEELQHAKSWDFVVKKLVRVTVSIEAAGHDTKIEARCQTILTMSDSRQTTMGQLSNE